MSTTPTGSYAAPLPAVTALDAAVTEAENPVRTFTYAGKTFEVVGPERLLKSAYMVQKGAATDSLYLLIDGAAEMIVESQRQQFIDWLLEEVADDSSDQVSFDGLIAAIFAAYEDGTARPLDKSGS